MQIKFAEENKEVVDMVQSVDLNKIFSIITFGAKDKETKQALDRAIQLVTIYSENHKNHEGNFLTAVKPILKNPEIKKQIGERSKKSFKKDMPV